MICTTYSTVFLDGDVYPTKRHCWKTVLLSEKKMEQLCILIITSLTSITSGLDVYNVFLSNYHGCVQYDNEFNLTLYQLKAIREKAK
jgi:hypothetical protein